MSTSDEIRSVVEAARAAQPEWAAISLRERTRRLKRAARQMLVEREDALRHVHDDIGKLPTETLMTEAAGPLDQLRQWASIFRRVHRRRRVRLNPFAFPRKRASIDLVPRGVVACITPWNYPLGILFRYVFPALLAGNGVVLKPSEHGARTGRWFVERLRHELPEGLLGLVVGGDEAGKALVASDVDAVTFTGSTAGGREVASACGRKLIPCTVELGGKDAAIVLADCDLDRTVAGITYWALHNGGQNCGAIERVYVEDTVADEFVKRLGDAWARLETTGDEADVSPLANEQQLAIVTRHVDDARARGARVVVGGGPTGEGLGYQPTVIDACTSEMTAMRDESFGPIVCVTRVRDVDEALRLANDSAYGLGGSVWTRNLAAGRRVASRLDCGVACVNNHAITGAIVALPWAGTKATGTGVSNSEYALATFLRPRTTLIDGSSKPDMFWMPMDRDLRRVGERIAALQLGSVSAVVKLPLLIRRRVKTIRDFFRARTKRTLPGPGEPGEPGERG